ncbi:transmembrane protein 135, partial [Tanacetum coccineum]
KLQMASGGQDLILALKETVRYGLFLGTFAGTFVSVDEFIAAVGGHRRTAKWRALLAGAIAGPSMLLTGPNTQHTSLAVYIFMRAAVLASRCGIKSERFGRICKPLTWAHGDLFLMCAYILKQDSLPQTYKSFLNKHGGKDLAILQGVRDIACGMPFTNLEQIQNYYNSTGVDVTLDPRMKVPCSIVHGNQSCSWHAITFFLEEYKRAVPVYLPVYLIPALIVHRQGLGKRPFTILAKGLFGTARSSLFLTTYCTSAWVWTCFLFRIFKRCNVTMLALGTFPTGISLAIEKKSRRIEISLYCLARAIESFFTTMSEIGYMPEVLNLKRVDVLIFSISTAIIMHCYAIERDVFRSKYLNVLDWVFGVPLPPYDTTPQKKDETS